MDCSICTTMPYMLRPPRNTVCSTCYEGARNMITLINKLQENQHEEVLHKSNNLSPSPISCKTLMDVSRWMFGMINKVNGQVEESNFLGEMVSAFKEQIHSDILVSPGNGGPSIPAHKAILAVRSEIFKNMLECDECKAAPNSSIRLAELNHQELECLLEFLYSGRVSKERLDKHVYAMLHTADKYEIPYLQKLCEGHMLDSLNVSNALDVLEASDICSNQELKETTVNFIVKNMEDIVFSSRYDVFALKSPHLSVQITRATLKTFRKQ